MFLVSFFFPSYQCWQAEAVKKKIHSAEKNTMLENAIPILTNMKAHTSHQWPQYWAHQTFPLQSEKFDVMTTSKAQFTPSFSISCLEATSCLRFRTSFLTKKSMRSWSHCIVCVFVFLPNEQSQCRRITRNIEKTRPGLTGNNLTM